MDAVTTTRRGAAAIVTLSAPDKRNALGLEVLQAVGRAVTAVSQEPGVGAVVLAGEGPAFSAGHDLAEMRCRDTGYYDELFAVCVEVMTTLHTVPQPVIAQVDGIATAAGCQLVAAADLAVVSDRSRFATPGVRIGLFCSTPMVPLTRAIGRKRALEMLLTGEPIDAATALAWGLVNRVVPPEELEASVDALVARLAQASGDVLAIGKAAFYDQIERTEAEAYELMAAVMSANAVLPDAQEGIAAFLEKRPPVWGSPADSAD